jgi:uncharacterized repeat protein (TIGR01451 family)
MAFCAIVRESDEPDDLRNPIDDSRPIDNTATANGTPAAGTLVPPVDTATVPVAPATPTLTVAKAAAVPVDVNSDGIIKSGDTITYTYTVTNTGNVTINNAAPVDTGPTFDGNAATGSLGAFSPASANLAPGASQVFTAVYTLSNVDAFEAAGLTNAVDNSATATGTPTTGTLGAVTPSTAETSIPANPALTVDKAFAFTTDNGTVASADVGDVITYTYTVVNTGNVAITSLSINDIHEGAALSGEPSAEALTTDGPLAPGTVSSDSVADNAVWTTIQPGATVTFTYVHTVTQAEVDAG